MSLLIVAAKNKKHAFELCEIYNDVASQCMVDEIEGIAGFLYDFKEKFLNYECYYTFDPYRDTYLKKSKVNEIKIFANSILNWIIESNIEEDIIIERYNLTFEKIKNFAIALNNICDFAIINGYGLVGLGD